MSSHYYSGAALIAFCISLVGQWAFSADKRCTFVTPQWVLLADCEGAGPESALKALQWNRFTVPKLWRTGPLKPLPTTQMIAAQSADVRAPVMSAQEQSSTEHLSKTVQLCTAGEKMQWRPKRQNQCWVIRQHNKMAAGRSQVQNYNGRPRYTEHFMEV